MRRPFFSAATAAALLVEAAPAARLRTIAEIVGWGGLPDAVASWWGALMFFSDSPIRWIIMAVCVAGLAWANREWLSLRLPLPPMSLRKAALLCLEETKGRPIADYMKAAVGEAGDSAHWYARWLGNKDAVTGIRTTAPATAAAPVPAAEFQRGTLSDDLSALRGPTRRSPSFDRLMVRRRDLRRQIAAMKAIEV